MSSTRTGRLRRAFAPDDAALAAPPPVAAPVRRTAPQEPQVARAPLDVEQLERLVLVTSTFARERAAALLEGLDAQQGAAAQTLLAALAARASADRQARVALLFGPVPEAPERLRYLMAEASLPLQAELLRRLPPYYRSLFPGGGLPRPGTSTPALGRLAERLIREATR